MVRHRNKIWGQLGEYSSKTKARKSIIDMKKAHKKSVKQFPHHKASKTKYFYDVRKKDDKWLALYRYNKGCDKHDYI